MNYSLEFSRRAFNYLRRLPRSSQDRFRVRIAQIAENPYGLHTKALAGSEGYRVSRVGGWRIIFRVDDAQRHVIVLEIGPRGQVYRGIWAYRPALLVAHWRTVLTCALLVR